MFLDVPALTPALPLPLECDVGLAFEGMDAASAESDSRHILSTLPPRLLLSSAFRLLQPLYAATARAAPRAGRLSLGSVLGGPSSTVSGQARYLVNRDIPRSVASYVCALIRFWLPCISFLPCDTRDEGWEQKDYRLAPCNLVESLRTSARYVTGQKSLAIHVLEKREAPPDQIAHGFRSLQAYAVACHAAAVSRQLSSPSSNLSLPV